VARIWRSQPPPPRLIPSEEEQRITGLGDRIAAEWKRTHPAPAPVPKADRLASEVTSLRAKADRLASEVTGLRAALRWAKGQRNWALVCLLVVVAALAVAAWRRTDPKTGSRIRGEGPAAPPSHTRYGFGRAVAEKLLRAAVAARPSLGKWLARLAFALCALAALWGLLALIITVYPGLRYTYQNVNLYATEGDTSGHLYLTARIDRFTGRVSYLIVLPRRGVTWITPRQQQR
jgi:hypothetical protein